MENQSPIEEPVVVTDVVEPFVVNITCGSCDYYHDCGKSIVRGGERRPAKNQAIVPIHCLNIVDDICRDCFHYLSKRCASWKISNGKRKVGTLAVCPKKLPVKPEFIEEVRQKYASTVRRMK